MAVKVEVPYRRVFNVAKDPRAVHAYLADVVKSVPTNFPGVEKFEPIGERKYRWHYEKVGYSSYELQIKYATEFHVDSPTRLRATAIPEPGGSTFDATWDLAPQGSGTQITFDAKFVIELPIPGFLKGMAGPVAQKELGKLFERYTSSVEKNLA